MDFALTDEQQEVVSAFDRALAKTSSVERVRALERDGWDPDTWRTLIEIGALDFVGGESASDGPRALELVLLGELLGRHLACVPFVEFMAATEVLRMSAVDVPVGDELVVLSPRPAVDGVARAIPGGAAAEAVVVLDGDELVLVRGKVREPVQDIGFSGAATWRVREGAAERIVIARGDEASRLWETGLAWWRAGSGGISIGLAEKALEVAVAYAKTREQFGVPIGAFQAVQHSLAEVLLSVEGARHFVRESAWRADRGESNWAILAAASYAFAAEAAGRSAERCLHVHGGYGYTLDYDPQLYLRRAKAIQLQGGDPEAIWTTVGRATMEGVI